MQLIVHNDELHELVREIVSMTLAAIDWPVGRLALMELEAAEAWGVRRHVLRDLGLADSVSFKSPSEVSPRRLLTGPRSLLNAGSAKNW
jgi:hypothetical protein